MANFTATEDQVNQIIANAINSSIPFGMGYLHYEERNYTADEIASCRDRLTSSSGQIDIDYFCGRMVKLHLQKTEDGSWDMWPDTFREDYQSFCHRYPTTDELIASVIAEPK